MGLEIRRALGAALWLTCAFCLYDIAGLPPDALRTATGWSDLAGIAARGLAAYGTVSLALAALCALAALVLGKRLGLPRHDARSSFPVYAGSCVGLFVLARSIAMIGERAGAPSWPGAAWLADALIAGSIALAAGRTVAGLTKSGHGRPRSRARLAGWIALSLLPSILLAAPVLRAAAAGAEPLRAAEGAVPHPDLLLIVTDSLRADAVGSMESGRTRTPSIDDLASRGTKFVDAAAAASSGPPSIASLMTSRLPSDVGFGGWSSRLTPGAVTLAEALLARGYQTEALVGNPGISREAGLDRGFRVWDASVDESVSARYPYLLTSRLSAAFGHHPREAWPDAHEMVNRALARLSKSSDHPRFVYLHLGDPHDPYMPPPDLLGTVEKETPGGLVFEKDTLSNILRGERSFDEADLRRTKALYAAEVAAVDREVGRLLGAISARIRAGRTLVVFTSDHGEELMDHGSLGHGQSLYQEILRVPLIVSGPGSTGEGRTIRTPVSLLDVAPTVLDLLGLPAEPSFTGRSLVPAMSGTEDGADPERIVSEMNSTGYHTERHWARSVREGNWKVLLFATDVLGIQPWRREVFDLASDPLEKSPIAEPPPEAARIETWLRDWASRHPPAPVAEPGPAGQAESGGVADAR